MSEFFNFWNDLGWLANLTAVFSVILTGFVLARKVAHKQIRKNNSAIRYETNRKMNHGVYLQWVQDVMSRIYAGVEFVSVYGKQYPATILRPGKPFPYPFTELCRLESTDMHAMQANRLQKKYLRFLGDSVKRPKMKGFATKEVVLDKDGRIDVVQARVTNYEQNLITAHILEWELFRRYRKDKSVDENMLSRLAFRSAYHGGQPPSRAILKPAQAYPLISVQALVIYKDYKAPENPEWKAIVAQRQKNVAIKPDVWQIQPAGGFEVYGHENDELEIQLQQGFDVRSALFREYAEELYNIEELSYCSDARDSGSILSEPHIAHLVKLIHDGKASVDFLGIVTDLTILRHELSFLILIDDEEYSRHPILGSSEARKMFSLGMEDLKKTFSTQNVHSSSAGLLQLAIDSARLKDAGISALLAATETPPSTPSRPTAGDEGQRAGHRKTGLSGATVP